MTFKPDEALLSRLLVALAPQVAGGIIVNNGRDLPQSPAYFQKTGFAVSHLQSNTGVATALNAGFRWAQAQGAEFVITFDQDSEPAPDMVCQLLRAYRQLVAAGRRVGAVGPQQIDRRTAQCVPFIAPISGLRRRLIPAAGQVVEADHLITSGCLVPIDAWKDTGAFLDALFIDYVDVEWSLRLRHGGWRLFGVGGATLTHSIGDEVKQWRNRQISWHRPVRHYFMFRNAVYLQRLPHIPFMWKVSDAFQLLKRFVFFSLVGRPRLTHVRAMLHGIHDGWRGRLGPASRPE